ncbi:MAG: hypothetical protein ACE5GA_08450 [Candidatus Zixiibacteriota bacterium]
MPNDKDKKHAPDPDAPAPKAGLTPIYLALLAGSLILIGHSLAALYMWKVGARLGVAFLATALILGSTRNLRLAALALLILWTGVAVTFLF